MLLASRGWGLGLLLRAAQCPGRSPTENGPAPDVSSTEVGRPGLGPFMGTDGC